MSIDTHGVPPPGTFIREELEARGWSQRDLAFVMDCPEQAVNMIISGKRGISPEMANLLGDAFDVSPDFFANLQKAFDMAHARKAEPGVARRGRIQAHYPLREMMKRGWLVETSDPAMLEGQLMNFFRVSTPGEIPHMRHAAKKTNYEEVPAPQLAWLFRVKQMAETQQVARYSEKALRASLDRLRSFLVEPEEARHVPRLLAESGVRFVLAEGLPQSKIDGVCFWTKGTPVIGMSLRYDRIDNFWFVLRHEIEHVLREDGKDGDVIDAELEGERASTSPNIPAEERAANAAAAEFVVPQADLQNFIARVRPMFSDQRVSQFARRIGVHPGLVVGQLQKNEEIPYANLRKHLVKVRQSLTSAALVDGWGLTPNMPVLGAH
jgi:HTH-type transcriptional regulator/antitoxin HigA